MKKKKPTAGQRMIESTKQALAFAQGREEYPPLAVVHLMGRPITEILAEARWRNSTAVLDDDFSKDLEGIIASHQRPRRRSPKV